MMRLRRAGLANRGKKALAMVFVVVATFVATSMASVSSAHSGQTFEVNNVGDPAEGDPNFGVCNVQICTLRTAIIAANNHPGPDTIDFNIPNPETRHIAPESELPAITEAVTIDGYSQLFTRPNTRPVGFDGRIDVQLVGSKTDSGEDGLVINADGVTMRGLAIHSFRGGSGIKIRGSRNTIEGNFIGTDRLGGRDGQGNVDGVFILDGQNNTIGGNTPAARNVISGNQQSGVEFFGTSLGTEANKVQNNYIGTDKFGTGALGNGAGGVEMRDSTFNVVGGTGEGEGNIIAFNAGDGVSIRSGNNIFADSGNSIRSNSIYSNGDLGIDLRQDGPTANDPLDPDEGENGLQNSPKITSAITTSGTTTIKGRLNSVPNKFFLIDVYANPSGGDEGKKFLGQKAITTNADGVRSFTLTPAQAVAAGQVITATATDQGRNTSEFSTPRTVVAQ
jgi:hypothetical protein